MLVICEKLIAAKFEVQSKRMMTKIKNQIKIETEQIGTLMISLSKKHKYDMSI